MIVNFQTYGNDFPYSLFDADGFKFMGYVVELDTVTGVVKCQVHAYPVGWAEYPKGTIALASIQLKAPLKLVGASGQVVNEEELSCDPFVTVTLPL